MKEKNNKIPRRGGGILIIHDGNIQHLNYFYYLLNVAIKIFVFYIFFAANSTYDDPEELDASASSLVSSTSNAYASFPVDVVVYIRVQASLVRFTCLPVSRVECLLRLPSLDLVFSTKRADVDGNFLPDTSPPPKNKSKTLSAFVSYF